LKLAADGEYNRLVVMQQGKLTSVPIEEVADQAAAGASRGIAVGRRLPDRSG
jgi:hypothetical protein